MDWNPAIERNSAALKRIVAMLVEMAGLGAPSLLPLWEKVSPSGERSEQEEKRRMRGVGRIADVSDPASTPHPTAPHPAPPPSPPRVRKPVLPSIFLRRAASAPASSRRPA